MGSNYNPAIVTDGLVLCLDAANKRSYPGTGTNWGDLSSNNFDGTLTNNPTFVSDQGGSYFQFDGTDDRTDFSYVQPAYQTTTDFTWCIWYYITSSQKSANPNGVIMGNRYHASDPADPPLEFVKLTPNNFEYYPDNLSLSTLGDQWQQTIIVKNQTTIIYYRNGERISSRSATNTLAQTVPFYLGGDLHAERTEVRISLAQIYDIPFSAEQVRQQYQATVGRYS